MVLEFGLLNSGLFQSSDAAGEGFNPDTQAALLNDLGFVVRKVFVDSTTVTRSNSSTQLTAASYTIPAGTVTNGVIIIAKGRGRGFNTGGGSSLSIWIGVPGAEVAVSSASIGISDHGLHTHVVMWTDTSQNWRSDVSVLFTIQNAVAAGFDTTIYNSSMILGF